MAKNKHAYDVGDLVRVSREVCEAQHHLPSGVVATVVGWGWLVRNGTGPGAGGDTVRRRTEREYKATEAGQAGHA